MADFEARSLHLHTLDSLLSDLVSGRAIAVDLDVTGIPHRLSAAQVRDYHWDVFDKYNVPRRAYGGTAVFGGKWETEILSYLWCGGGCDSN